MNFFKKGETNWKYILIVVILAIIVGGGTLWFLEKQELPYQPPEIKKPEKAVENDTANWKAYKNLTYKYEVKYPEDGEISTIYRSDVTFAPSITLKSSKIRVEITILENLINPPNEYHTFENFVSEETRKSGKCLAGKCYEIISSKKIEVKSENFSGLQHQMIFKLPPEFSEATYFDVAIKTYIPKNNNVFIISSGRDYLEEAEIPSEFLNLYNKILSTFRFIELEETVEETECEKWRKECAEEGENLCGPCGCKSCCPGLIKGDVTYPYRNKNNEVFCLEEMTAYTCVKCGDKICGKGEDWCICPEDCPKPNPEDLQIFIMPE